MSAVAYRLRRKIFWRADGLSATIDFGTRKKPDRQELRWSKSRFIQPVGDKEYVDGVDWILQWEGMIAETFASKVGLMLYLIRMAYSVEAGYLIPSEILYDAGLQYPDGWIDTWTELDLGDKLIAEIKNPADLEPPANRRIQMEPYIHVPRGAHARTLQAKSYPHMDLEEAECVPRERVRFREIGPDWEDPCPWYKKSTSRPVAELAFKYRAEGDEGDDLQRRLQAALAVHSSD